jgi:hypothetical protein
MRRVNAPHFQEYAADTLSSPICPVAMDKEGAQTTDFSLKTKGLGMLCREFFIPAVMPLYVSSADALVRANGLKSITIFDLVDFAHQNQVNRRTTPSLPMMRQAADDMEGPGVINMFADILREHAETVDASNALRESILGEAVLVEAYSKQRPRSQAAKS